MGNLPRVLPDGLGAVLDRSTVGGAPDLRRDPAPRARSADEEMDRVFNRGVGMALVVAAGAVDAALAALAGAGSSAGRPGRVGDGRRAGGAPAVAVEARSAA